MAATLTLLLLLLTAYAVVPHVYQDALMLRLLRTCRRHRLIAITFDDGPGRQLTPLVLERLAITGTKATFFVLGNAALEHPDLIATIRARGHEIGSHGQAHVHHLRSMPWHALRDTTQALAGLARLLGSDLRGLLFRPPHGKLNLLSFAHAWWRGARIAVWSHDGFDTRLGVDVPPATTADSLRSTGGGIVLLHDFDRTIPNPTARVLARLDEIIHLAREGYRFVGFGELLDIAAGHRQAPAPWPELAANAPLPPAMATFPGAQAFGPSIDGPAEARLQSGAATPAFTANARRSRRQRQRR